ncbi:DEKNAAC104578 [Brettanomyces naardenensis]|uniref:DEKNAAC104578 n=1 Tax=Brettanomyces naardenensis TaxID=13370 RepID=A0A448YRE7_BRENA|nr:DEKNAAC104578 [Brettanomyces naardenensis]
MNFVSLFASAVFLFGGSVLAENATHVYNWTAQWGTANPDGLFERRVVTCNGEYPWPAIKVTQGDRIVVNLSNGLPDQNTSVHFHGLFQHDTNEFDGVPMLTQCDIPPNETLTYNFTVPDQHGPYWYHSHSKGQYMDGMVGPVIIEDIEKPPYDYDEEVLLTLEEWYHKEVSEMIPEFLNRFNPTGAEPIPQVLLFNNTLNGTWAVKPDTTYLLHIINTGGFLSQYLWMEDHTFTVVGVDGIYVEPNETDYIYITVAQRYDVLIHTKNDTSRNYAFMQSMDETMLDTETEVISINSTNAIVYNASAPMPQEYLSDDYIDDILDDFYLTPSPKEDAMDDYDYQIKIDVLMNNLDDGVNYAFFNNITYVAPKVPTLGSVLSAGDFSTNDLVYGTNTHPFVLQKDEIVEIVVNNNDTGKHPFHLHGHVFQVLERGPDFSDAPGPIPYNESAPYTAPEYPLLRDTLYVNPQSYFRIRFKADNPGVWFFHCHIEWHLLQGLAITLVEDPESIQARQSVTDNWKDVCAANGVPFEGNAANNTENLLDLTGQNLQVKSLPSGFTAKGIVAMVFSCLAGILGCAVICIYGMADIPNLEEKVYSELSPEEKKMLDNEDDEEDDDDSTKKKEGSSEEEKKSATNITSETVGQAI